MILIVALGPYSSADMFLPDQGNFWYYWKLAEPTFWTHFSAWTLYGLHQLSIWGLIAWAQRQRHRYTRTLHPVNLAALGCNLLFVCLHIAQTKLFYDGLAQDTPVVSSQMSVVFMLVFILIMENSRRGIFFGRKVAFLDRPGGFLRRYHGYYFSWAIIYTFWFHPIEDNLGHLLGIFYTLLLLLQGSLFFTAYHRNRQRAILSRAFPHADCRREHRQHDGQRGHQHGAHAPWAGLADGGAGFHAFTAVAVDQVNQQDGVFGHQAHQQ